MAGDKLGHFPSRSIRPRSPSNFLFKYYSPISPVPHHPPNPKFPPFKLHPSSKSLYVANQHGSCHSIYLRTYISRSIPSSSPNLPKSRIRRLFSLDRNPVNHSKGDPSTKYKPHPNIRNIQAKLPSPNRSTQAKDIFFSHAHNGTRQNLQVQFSGSLASTEVDQKFSPFLLKSPLSCVARPRHPCVARLRRPWVALLFRVCNFFTIVHSAGAGFSGSKMARRIGSIEEFEFKFIGENYSQGALKCNNWFDAIAVSAEVAERIGACLKKWPDKCH